MPKLKRIFLCVVYAFILFGLGAGSFLYLSSANIAGAFEGLANKLLTYSACCLVMLLMEAISDWKHRIETLKAFDKIEADSAALGRFLGMRALALSIPAAAIFGQI